MKSAATARLNDKSVTNRFSRVGRMTARMMLGLLVLTAVLSGSLRECFGQNGHHAIEWLHGEKLEPGKQHTPALRSVPFDTDILRSTDPSCVDQLIFAETLRADPPLEFRPPRFRHIPFVAVTQAHSIRAGFLGSSSIWQHFACKGLRDPALTTLRTIVLLN
jgi:hypothetical protein